MVVTSLLRRIREASWAEWLFALIVWCFVLEYATYLIRDDLADKLIKLVLFSCMFLMAFSWRALFEFRERQLLLIFSILFASVALPSLVGMDATGLLQWGKHAFMAMVLVFVLMREEQVEGQISLVIGLYLFIAALFSLQAISGFLLVLFDGLDINTFVEIGRRPGQVARDLGLFGYANALQNPVEGVWVLRAQGWFVEPSILGAFLVFPAFVSYGIFRDDKRFSFLFLAMIAFLAIILTFSLAGYFAILAGVLFLLLSKPLYRLLKGSRFSVFLYATIILAVFGVCAKGMLHAGVIMNEINLALVQEISTESETMSSHDPASRDVASRDVAASMTKMFARDTHGQSGRLFREIYAANYYISSIIEHPLGIGLGRTLGTSRENSANALFFWAISGGLFSLLVLILFFWHIFSRYCHPLLMSQVSIQRCVAASFVGHAIHDLSYGNWLAPFFLIHLAVLVTLSWRMDQDA